MSLERMTSTERQAASSLSAIMALRMIGLFMVVPVFSIYARQLKGATPTLIGLALGIYGLTQALCQIPFGALSDRVGRKPIIFVGLCIFAIGSVVAASADSIVLVIVGRALQGIGAVGSTVLAMLADLTREEQRTKAMAIAGISIGLSFSLAMMIGPLLSQWLAVNKLFYLASCFSLVAIIILYKFVPNPAAPTWHPDTEPQLSTFLSFLCQPELARLNSGIFILHAIFTASFIALPISLQQVTGLAVTHYWLLYLPTLLLACILTLFFIRSAEKNRQIKSYFLASIVTLAIAECLFWVAPIHLLVIALGLCLFFTGFSILEAFLPSLVSRTAPPAKKGSALGVYSCAQFLGIFSGGVLGGWIYGQFHSAGVYIFCIVLALLWLTFALFMQPPYYRFHSS